MDIATVAIWISLILTGLGFIAIVLFGIRSVINGKFRLSALLAMLVPVVVFGIIYVMVSGSPDPMAAAGVFTSLVLLVIGIVAVVVLGVKGAFGL